MAALCFRQGGLNHTTRVGQHIPCRFRTHRHLGTAVTAVRSSSRGSLSQAWRRSAPLSLFFSTWCSSAASLPGSPAPLFSSSTGPPGTRPAYLRNRQFPNLGMVFLPQCAAFRAD
jgi:hypothetical protein